MSSRSDGAIDLTLKSISLLPLDLLYSSDGLHPTSIPLTTNIRQFYLENDTLVPPPIVSCSEFVSRKLVALLMRGKKDGAIAVKFEKRTTSNTHNLDAITDMEGVIHTFVTPVVPRCEMIGDYRFRGRHGVCRFGVERMGNETTTALLTRSVALSASIQMDFENSKVMLRACSLGDEEIVGRDLGANIEWEILNIEEKQNDQKRMEYDESLRQHMIFHLTSAGRFPGVHEVHSPLNLDTTVSFLETLIHDPADTIGKTAGKYTQLYDGRIISLEFLFMTAIHQARNELSVLEAIYPQGYVYTYDPASIFAREIGAPILNRLMVAALKFLSDHNQFRNMRIFGFNDYADPGAISLVKEALRKQSHIRVVGKAELFKGPGGTYDTSDFPEARSSMLVVHNNSDAFGQNIETEGGSGSLDGAIGSNSSAAGSLKRDREDLLKYVC